MQAVRPLPRLHETEVIDRREPADGVVILGLSAPELAREALAGQFVMTVPPGGGLSATALGIYEADAGRVSLMVIECGPRTRELAMLPLGTPLALLAPLGNGFNLEALGSDVGIVAGGIGIASLYLAAAALQRSRVRARLYYGARKKGLLVDLEKFEALGIPATLATDDGSLGMHGFVTDALRERGSGHSGLIACGPSPMLRAVGRIAGEFAIPAQLSLEETFACGVGACWGCIVPLSRDSAQAPAFPEPAGDEGRGYVNARICKEGPVFWSHELRW